MGNWHAIDVDGDHFEWNVVDTGIGEADGRPKDVPHAPTARVRLLLLRRRGAEQSFGVVQDAAYDPKEEAIAAEIRAWRSSTPLSREWRPDERTHARELATRWGRLPQSERDELGRLWLARCAQRCPPVPTIADPTDLHAIAAETLRAARARSPEHGDEEAEAQKRDVLVAFERQFPTLSSS